MKIELIPVTLQLPPETHVRSQGVHVSQVIRNLAVKNSALDKKWVNPEDLYLFDLQDSYVWWNKLDSASRLRMAIGLAWENWYAETQLVPDGVSYHADEMCVNGIYMTKDGESLDVIVTPSQTSRLELALHEIKTTSKSTRWPIDHKKWWMAVSQCKAYCKGMDTLIAYLHVLYLYGDYMKPFQPQLRKWRIEFDQCEIDSTWEEIEGEVAHNRMMEVEELLEDTYNAAPNS